MPQITRMTIAPTTAPMNPAPSPGRYQPTAWPRYVAAIAPTIPKDRCQNEAAWLIGAAGMKKLGDDARKQTDDYGPHDFHLLSPGSLAVLPLVVGQTTVRCHLVNRGRQYRTEAREDLLAPQAGPLRERQACQARAHPPIGPRRSHDWHQSAPTTVLPRRDRAR